MNLKEDVDFMKELGRETAVVNQECSASPERKKKMQQSILFGCMIQGIAERVFNRGKGMSIERIVNCLRSQADFFENPIILKRIKIDWYNGNET